MNPVLKLLCPALIAALPAAAQDIAEGRALYERHCATCHGLVAEGGGPMAPALVLQPPDLTTLQTRYGGTFPVLRVVRRIDGREPLVSHGSPMPVYGGFFEGVGAVAVKTAAGQPVMTSQPIADLVMFLQALQR